MALECDFPYVREALQCRKWAFAADVIRLYALYKWGGIYMDSDVIVKKSLDDFSIGYSQDFNSLINHLKNKYTKDVLINSGLASEKNGKLYDTQAERLVFPIKNQMGQIVGFSGRILTDNKELAKYKIIFMNTHLCST